MKISTISDVHIKSSGDRAERLLISFLRSQDVRESNVVFLLGDIFDLMIGPHSQYFARFEVFFKELKILLELGVKVCYVEGNHDFHLRKLFQNFFLVHKQLDANLFELRDSFKVESGGKKIHLSHGDEIELGNLGYKIFKFVVRSKVMRFVAEYFVPHYLMRTIGEASAEKSRKLNNKKYSKEADLEPVKCNFRKSVEEFHKISNCDIYILGHSHVKDYFSFNNEFIYVNNGYVQNTYCYITVEDGKVEFKQLDSFV